MRSLSRAESSALAIRRWCMAEVGINHEGSVNKALQLVDAAAAAGAEVVKFQCHITEKEMVPTDMTPGEISNGEALGYHQALRTHRRRGAQVQALRRTRE